MFLWDKCLPVIEPTVSKALKAMVLTALIENIN